MKENLSTRPALPDNAKSHKKAEDCLLATKNVAAQEKRSEEPVSNVADGASRDEQHQLQRQSPSAARRFWAEEAKIQVINPAKKQGIYGMIWGWIKKTPASSVLSDKRRSAR